MLLHRIWAFLHLRNSVKNNSAHNLSALILAAGQGGRAFGTGAAEFSGGVCGGGNSGHCGVHVVFAIATGCGGGGVGA
jgi:hypothetical protein